MRLQDLTSRISPLPWKYDVGNWELEDANRKTVAPWNVNGSDIDGNEIQQNPIDGEYAALACTIFPYLLGFYKSVCLGIPDKDFYEIAIKQILNDRVLP